MADEQQAQPTDQTKQGIVWQVLDVFFARDGRRTYDKSRTKIVIIAFAILEVVIRLGYRFIDKQQDNYHEAMTRVQVTEVEERRSQHHENLDALREQTKAIVEMAQKLQQNTETVREATLMQASKKTRK